MLSQLENSLEGKNVVVVAEFSSSSGGTRTYFFNLIHYYLQREGLLTILLPEHLVDEEVAALTTTGKVKIVKLTRSGLANRLERYPFNIINRVAEHLKISSMVSKQQPDLVVVSLGLAGKLLSLVTLPYRLIYVMHTLPQGARRFSLNKVLARRFGKQKVLLTVSRYARQQIARFWLSHDRIENLTYIYNTVPYQLNQVAFRPIIDENIVVLTLGHVVAYKNPRLWIAVAKRVIAQHPSAIFTWAGEGELLAECRVSVEEYPNINFIGSQKKVGALLAKTDIYFHPSREESHGIAVVEAMKYGLPCVVSDVGGLVESVVHEETGFIANVDSVEDFSTYLLMLIQDPAMRTRLGEKGKGRFSALFSYQAWEESMDQLHARLFI